MSNRSDQIPVIEIFGPVIQGEGMVLGHQTWFVRTGACDYLCDTCDSLHAVLPAEIEKNKTVMDAEEIATTVLEQISAAKSHCKMVTLSGGNPAVWDLTKCVDLLKASGISVAIETQGSIFRHWIRKCQFVTISPKGPGMVGKLWPKSITDVKAFLLQYLDARESEFDATTVLCLKIPVFSDADLEFADMLIKTLRDVGIDLPVYLSVGNSWVEDGRNLSDYTKITNLRNNLIDRYKQISEEVLTEWPSLSECIILPQWHVVCYGNEHKR